MSVSWIVVAVGVVLTVGIVIAIDQFNQKVWLDVSASSNPVLNILSGLGKFILAILLYIVVTAVVAVVGGKFLPSPFLGIIACGLTLWLLAAMFHIPFSSTLKRLNK
jgi:tetrahydromethanopterin S-methyltransferase subunit E